MTYWVEDITTGPDSRPKVLMTYEWPHLRVHHHNPCLNFRGTLLWIVMRRVDHVVNRSFIEVANVFSGVTRRMKYVSWGSWSSEKVLVLVVARVGAL